MKLRWPWRARVDVGPHECRPVASSVRTGHRFKIETSPFGPARTCTGTLVLMRCTCGKVGTVALDGNWTMEELLGRAALPSEMALQLMQSMSAGAAIAQDFGDEEDD